MITTKKIQKMREAIQERFTDKEMADLMLYQFDDNVKFLNGTKNEKEIYEIFVEIVVFD